MKSLTVTIAIQFDQFDNSTDEVQYSVETLNRMSQILSERFPDISPVIFTSDITKSDIEITGGGEELFENSNFTIGYIDSFMDTFGSEGDYIQVIPQDHICVEWEDTEYYLKKDNSIYSEKEWRLFVYLEENLQV